MKKLTLNSTTFWTGIPLANVSDKINLSKKEANQLQYNFAELCNSSILDKICFSKEELKSLLLEKKHVLPNISDRKLYNLVKQEYLMSLLIDEFSNIRKKNTGSAWRLWFRNTPWSRNTKISRIEVAHRTLILLKENIVKWSVITLENWEDYIVTNIRYDCMIMSEWNTFSINPERIINVKSPSNQFISKKKTDTCNILNANNLSIEDLKNELSKKGIVSIIDLFRLWHRKLSQIYWFQNSNDAITYLNNLCLNSNELLKKSWKKPTNNKKILIYVSHYIFNKEYASQWRIQEDIFEDFFKLTLEETNIDLKKCNLRQDFNKLSVFYKNTPLWIQAIDLIFSIARDKLFSDHISGLCSGAQMWFYEFEIVLKFLRKKCK